MGSSSQYSISSCSSVLNVEKLHLGQTKLLYTVLPCVSGTFGLGSAFSPSFGCWSPLCTSLFSVCDLLFLLLPSTDCSEIPERSPVQSQCHQLLKHVETQLCWVINTSKSYFAICFPCLLVHLQICYLSSSPSHFRWSFSSCSSGSNEADTCCSLSLHVCY